MTTLPTNTQILYPPPPEGNARRPFLTPIPGLPGEFLLVLDNTALEHVKRCHKDAQIYLIKGRQGRGNEAALTYGGAIHAGLEVFHKEQWQKVQGQLAPDSSVDIAAQDQSILSHFSSNPSLPDWRSPAVALEVLSHYRKRCNPELYPDYDWDIVADDKGPIIERAFEIPMGVCNIEVPLASLKNYEESIQLWFRLQGPEYPIPIKIHLAWSGRMDLITQWQGSTYYTDHKTSSIGPEEFLLGCQFASQFIGYTWAGKEMVKMGMLPESCNTNKFCVNRIELRKPSKTGPVTGLLDRGPRGGEPRLSFSRHYFEYSDERISRWLEDTKLLIEDFLHSVSRNHFPLNDSACFNKFGRCQYWDACSIDNEEIGDKFLESDAYKEVTWNPTT